MKVSPASMEEWVEDGGHLVLLVEHANAETNDWSKGSTRSVLEPALVGMLEPGRDQAGECAMFQKTGESIAASSSKGVLRGGRQLRQRRGGEWR